MDREGIELEMRRARNETDLSEMDLESPLPTPTLMRAQSSYTEEINRSGNACQVCLKCMRLDRCFEKPVSVPKKGEPIRSIRLQVPLTKKFLESGEDGSDGRRNNEIKTSKYTVWTFLPLAGAFQFKRFVNLFFLIIVILLVIGNLFPKVFLTPWQAAGTATYLAILVVAGMTVEGLDDVGKHRGDKEENQRPIERIRMTDGEIVQTTWGELLPGDLVIIEDRGSVPADVVLLYGASNDKRNMCYIETSGIDGETNLKIKDAPMMFTQKLLEQLDLSGPRFGREEKAQVAKVLSTFSRGIYEYEQPNAFLQFNGSFSASSSSFPDKVPLEFRHLLLRGSTLRNTKWMIGLVMYAGHETKLALSRSISRPKFSRIDTLVNSLMYVLLVVYLIICGVADGLLFAEPDTAKWWYFQYTSSTSGYYLPGGLAFYLTFIVLFSNFIPISMVLLTEILNKHMQRMINNDLAMYHPETDTPAACRSASLSAEIGQVTHFFSDKTGTLTRNEMKLVGVYVDHKMYGVQPVHVDSDGSQVSDSNMNRPNPESSVEEEEALLELQEDIEAGGDASKKQIREQSQEEIFRDLISLLQQPSESEERRKALDMLVFLAVCHTVIFEKDSDTGEVSINSESPDEEAFVTGAAKIGVKLVEAGDGVVKIEFPDGTQEEYHVLALNPFNSTRKRMSLVLSRSDESIVVMMKGADNVMLERIAPGQDDLVDDLREKLLRYAWAGLRTLVMGSREMTENEFLEWEQRYKEAAVAPSAEREEALAAVAEEVEQNVRIVGATAIEDQLQLGVPEAIKVLRDSGIQVWVLTGDKIETAINIGLSSKLLDASMLQMKLISGDKDLLWSQIDEILATLNRAVEAIKDADTTAVEHFERQYQESGGNEDDPLEQLDFVTGAYSANCLALIVSGDALEHLLVEQKGNAQVQEKFLHVARACKVVLACRVSPKQKSLIVEMVRYAKKSKFTREPVTLAIGDGANDVPMIQSAHVGIGISGHEGRQATNASDFSLAQFRFVVRLLLFHGRHNYRRHATVITFLIYCWVYYVMVLYIFQPYCLWSGQQVYYEYFYTFFAAYYFNFAIIAHGWFNTDLSWPTILENPWTYARGAKNHDLDLSRLGLAFSKGLLHVLLTWAFVILTAPYTVPQEVLGTALYTTVFFVLYMEQLLAGNSFTNITFLAFLLIIVLFMAGMAVFTVPPIIYTKSAGAGFLWLQVLFCVGLILFLNALAAYIKMEWFPSPLDVLIEQDKGFVDGRKVVCHEARKSALKVMEEAARLVFYPIPLTVKTIRDAIKKQGPLKTELDKRQSVFESVQPVPEHFAYPTESTSLGEATLEPRPRNVSAPPQPSSDQPLPERASSSRSLARFRTVEYQSKRSLQS